MSPHPVRNKASFPVRSNNSPSKLSDMLHSYSETQGEPHLGWATCKPPQPGQPESFPQRDTQKLDGEDPLDVILDKVGWGSPGASNCHLLCQVEMAKLQNEAEQRQESRSELIVLASETLEPKVHRATVFSMSFFGGLTSGILQYP